MSYEDVQIVTTGLSAVAGKRREEFSPELIIYEDMRSTRPTTRTSPRATGARPRAWPASMLEGDYPHSDATWPDPVNLARKWLGDRVDDFTPAERPGRAS